MELPLPDPVDCGMDLFMQPESSDEPVAKRLKFPPGDRNLGICVN